MLNHRVSPLESAVEMLEKSPEYLSGDLIQRLRKLTYTADPQEKDFSEGPEAIMSAQLKILLDLSSRMQKLGEVSEDPAEVRQAMTSIERTINLISKRKDEISQEDRFRFQQEAVLGALNECAPELTKRFLELLHSKLSSAKR